MTARPYRFLPLIVAAFLAACGEADIPAAPAEIAKDTACSLDGMILMDFPGPKGQILYERGEREFMCDTKELFSLLLAPEQKKRIVAAYTQDMAKADWSKPEGYWVDARTAFYVAGSERRGSMGPTLASFAREEDARAFARHHGGKVVPFKEVTLDMVDITGGNRHDHGM